MKTRTLEAFISEANTLYNNKFSYDNTVYINSYTKLTITCPIHGDFEQTPLQHLRGNGCVKCSHELNRQERIKAFLDAADKVHNGRYSYDTSMYTNNRTTIPITCELHGIFHQTPSNHLKGHGCQACQYEQLKIDRTKPQDIFIAECTIIHKNKYSYENTVYKGTHKKVCIICPEHGNFTQWAGHHIRGVGCPKCSAGGFNLDKPGILYYLSINDGQCFKIGVTNLSVTERFTKADLEKITIIEEVFYDKGIDAYNKEQSILSSYKEHKYTIDKPLASGNTELFNIDIRKLNEIDTIRKL